MKEKLIKQTEEIEKHEKIIEMQGNHSDIKIIVSTKTKEIFDKYRQTKRNSIEACGILIGRHSVDGKKIIINIATSPSKSDKRGTHYFKIDSNHHQQILHNRFIESENESVYLGTWHTHPEPVPFPSRYDIEDWKKQYRENKHLFDNMIFIIVGERVIKYWLINNGILSEIKKKYVFYECL